MSGLLNDEGFDCSVFNQDNWECGARIYRDLELPRQSFIIGTDSSCGISSSQSNFARSGGFGGSRYSETAHKRRTPLPDAESPDRVSCVGAFI